MCIFLPLNAVVAGHKTIQLLYILRIYLVYNIPVGTKRVYSSTTATTNAHIHNIYIYIIYIYIYIYIHCLLTI